MRKILYLILVAGLIGVCLTIPGEVQAQKIDPTKVSALLKAGAGTVGGTGHVQMTALSKIVEDAYPKIKMSIVPGAWIGNIFRTNKGELDIGSTTLVVSKMAHDVKGPYQEPLPNVRTLVCVQDDNYYFAVVRKDFPADSVEEIVKKKIKARLCTLSRGNATEWVWRMTMAEMGVKWEDIDRWGGKMNFVSWPDAVSLVKDGHADGILAVGIEGIGWCTELSTVRDVKFLKWDPDLYQKMVKKWRFVEGKKMRAGAFRGLDEDLLCPGDSGVFVVRVDLAEDVVYTLLKALAENEAKFQAFHKGLRGFKAADMAKYIAFPLHKGAEMLYREKGLLK